MIERCYKRFGWNVREARINRGMSQQQLADRAGLVRTSIVNIEAGRQRVLLDDVITFAKALRTNRYVLLNNVF